MVSPRTYLQSQLISGLKNNQMHILRKIAVTIALNGWVTQAKVSVIAENHQSTLARDLMESLVLEPVQIGKVMRITGEESEDSAEGLHELKT